MGALVRVSAAATGLYLSRTGAWRADHPEGSPGDGLGSCDEPSCSERAAEGVPARPMVAKRRAPARGRYWLALWLLFFLVALAWVVARQTTSVATAARLAAARNARSLLEARKAELQRRVRGARSRGVLIPRAEALGLRLPADSEIVILRIPDPERR